MSLRVGGMSLVAPGSVLLTHCCLTAATVLCGLGCLTEEMGVLPTARLAGKLIKLRNSQGARR